MSAEPIRLHADEGIAVPPQSPRGEAPLPPEHATELAQGPTGAQVADATDGSIAGRLRAKHAEITRGTREFDVPGWDGDLVVVVGVLRDRKRLANGLKNEQLIVEATRKVLYRDENGELQDLGGWEGAARTMGLAESVTLGEVIRVVLDNPLRLDGFAASIVQWMMGRRDAIEAMLGE